MKKLLSLGILTILTNALLFSAPKQTFVSNSDGSISIKTLDKDASVKENQKVDGFSDVTVVTGSKIKKNNPITIDLSQFTNKDVYIKLSCDLKIVDKTGSENDIIWMINEPGANIPTLVQKKIPSGEWTKFQGEAILTLGEKRNLYISGAGLNKQNLTFYIRNLDVNISGEGIASEASAPVSWIDAPSIAEAYKNYFDYFGLAIGWNGELNDSYGMEGISHQANCITMGNELKPDFLFNWRKFNQTQDFVAEDGKTYQVPVGLPDFGTLNLILSVAKDCGLQIRGHVLVWHSQTPSWFFAQDYSTDDKAPLADKATMTARQEWYIKTVLEYVQNWEQKKNGGKRIITTWDVVNEAASDNASDARYLREDSKWFKIYKDDTFIVNAFRYANKYAPKDVLLCYNDYNCYSPNKTKAICKIVDSIQATPDARIDVVGMQSHIRVTNPITGNNSVENAVKAFVAKGLDVQITELDIANAQQKYSGIKLKAKYKEFFKMCLKNRKTPDKHGIRGITVWGLSDKGTWLDNQPEYKGYKQYPLLFDSDMNCKPAFWGVLEAAQEYQD